MTTVEKIHEFVLQAIEDTDCFLVSYSVKPTNNYKIFIDADGGFTVEKSLMVSRYLRKKIEEEALYPEGDFSLEVSSPGIDEPLLLHRQYVKNINRLLEIETTNEEQKKVEGKLVDVNEEKIVIETIATKKIESIKIEIPFVQIKKAIVQIQFN